MLTKRIIACLDVTGGRVVKGVQFVDLIDAGDPAELAARHAEAGADEIVLLDISATHEGRGTLLDTVQRTAQRLFVPFTVGGGVRTLDDAAAVFDAGADKVSVNSAASAKTGADRRDWRAIWSAGGDCGDRRATDRGRSPEGAEVFVEGGRKATGRKALDWAREAEQRGAGEILLTSMDADGTRAGFDCELTAAVSEAVQIPVIASGGAGNARHFSDGILAREGGCGAGGEHFSLRHFGCAGIERRDCARWRCREAALLIPSIDLMGGRIVQLVQGAELKARL